MAQLYVPTRLVFGAGSLRSLLTMDLPGKKAMLIRSNGNSAKRCGALDQVKEMLRQRGVEVAEFAEIEANPLRSTVMRARDAVRRSGSDFLVALGGGSVMDASKAIAAMAVSEGDLWDYVVGGTGKGKPLPAAPLPIVAITTTAGTGSEVDPWGVITNEQTHEKIGFGGDERLYPVIGIVDPELMLTVPPQFTAFQGFDALFHSTEGFISNVANPISDMVARTAIEHIGAHLPAAVRDGQNVQARTGVAFANTMSGYTMVTASCTSEHSLEHAMSAYHQNLPHGAGLILISLAYYEFFIRKHVCDDRFVQMAKFLGKTDAKDPEDFLVALAALQRECGVADLKMSDYGMVPSEFETLAQNAKDTMGGLFEADRCVLSVEDCIGIYQKSYR